MITVTIQGIDETLKALNIPFGDVAQAITHAVAEEAALPRLREYPPASGRKQPFKSDKSRRYFFAALRSGKITVPYPRTGKLAASWQLSSVNDGGGNITNRRSYDTLVQGETGEQAKYFFGTWQTVTEVAALVEQEEAGPIAERVTQEMIDRSKAGP